MSMETILAAALAPLCPRVFPDIAPKGTTTPYITWQQVGGEPVNFIDTAVPSKKNARVQVNVWATTRLDASSMGALVEDTLRMVAALRPTVLSAMTAVYEPETTLRGTMQDFSFWV